MDEKFDNHLVDGWKKEKGEVLQSEKQGGRANQKLENVY
jgi:hypothetical protein